VDRRSFFRRAAQKAGHTLVREADERVKARARHWLRPPYAIDELDFLLACTRCGECISACPHQVIFALPARLGAQVTGTPALDLLNHGCHLCADWPCVAACEPGALRLPETAQGQEPGVDTPPPPPRLATARIDTTRCLPYQGPECGACDGSCPVDGALSWEQFKPKIDSALCTGCGLCREACIVEPKAVQIEALQPEPSQPASDGRQERRDG